MANDALVGAPLTATGGVLSAPAGTALPTTASTALAAPYYPLGLIGEDGLSETADRSTDMVRAWGGSIVKTVQTEFGLMYSFQFITTNAVVLKEVHGDANVTTTTAVSPAFDELAIKVNAKQLPVKPYVFEVRDGENKIRIVVPKGQITAIGGITYSHADIIRYEVTLTCYPDDAGNEGYKYITGPAVDA